MSEYAGQQFVGIDLHRRRSVIVRSTAAGEVLESVRIVNDVDRLNSVMARAGVDPEVMLEATYGWYWAVDALQDSGANVHLAHPLGVKAFEYRRVKNDVRDATDLADLLRMGRLPEAWIAPPATRELRELVRHRAKLVSLRSHCKAEVHAVLAKCGVQVLMSDLFGVDGNELLDRLQLPAPYAARIASLRRLIDNLDFEIDLFTGLARGRLVRDPGYVAVQQIPGIGSVLAAVFVAEIGDVTRFATAPQLACWAGLTPKHHESDTHEPVRACGSIIEVDGYQVLDSSYRALLGVIDGLDDRAGWRNTRCAGWTVRDLVHHLWSDAQRGLVALHTPAAGPADVDSVSYWRPWQPGTPGAEAGLRGTRTMASAWSSVEPMAALYAETARGVLVAGRGRAGGDLVGTQGHVLTVDTLFRTLAVEATIHHLDLGFGEPSEEGIAETRRVLDGLLGRPAPIRDSVRYALIGTGRESLTEEEAQAPGADAERLPIGLWDAPRADRSVARSACRSSGGTDTAGHHAERDTAGLDLWCTTGFSGRHTQGSASAGPGAQRSHGAVGHRVTSSPDR